MATTNIENLEDTIKEMESAIDYIYRVVSIGSDRHRQQHYVFPGLPIIIEKPIVVETDGRITSTQWYYINDEDEYFSNAKQLSKYGYCEKRLQEEILKIMTEQIKENFEKYREALVEDTDELEKDSDEENDEVSEFEDDEKKPEASEKTRQKSGSSTAADQNPSDTPILSQIGQFV